MVQGPQCAHKVVGGGSPYIGDRRSAGRAREVKARNLFARNSLRRLAAASRSRVGALFDSLPVEKADGFHGNCADPHFVPGPYFDLLRADLLEFARVEPVTGAVRAMVHLDLATSAEEMALEFHAVAARTGALSGRVHAHGGVDLDAQEMFGGRFTLLVHALKFKRV